MRSAAEPRAVPESKSGDAEGDRRSYRTIVAVAASVAAVAALSIVLTLRASNSSTGPSAAGPLAGVTWQGAEPILTVVFTDDTVRISDGCTNELHQVTIGDGVLDVGKLLGPVSVCTGHPLLGGPPPDVTAFGEVVDSPHLTWQRNGDTLQLANDQGHSVSLHTAGAALGVTDQEWVLERFNDPRGYSHTSNYSAARLFISQDGAVSASDLCDELTGSASVTDTTITFTAMRSTTGTCTDQAATQVADVVDQVLSGSVTYSIRGDELIIDGDRRGLLIYTPA